MTNSDFHSHLHLLDLSASRVIGLCGTHAASCYTLGDLKSHLCYARRSTIIEHCLQHLAHGVSHYIRNTSSPGSRRSLNTACSTHHDEFHTTLAASDTSYNSQSTATLSTLPFTLLTRHHAASRASQLTVISYDTESSSSSNYNTPMQFILHLFADAPRSTIPR